MPEGLKLIVIRTRDHSELPARITVDPRLSTALRWKCAITKIVTQIQAAGAPRTRSTAGMTSMLKLRSGRVARLGSLRPSMHEFVDRRCGPGLHASRAVQRPAARPGRPAVCPRGC